MHRLSIVLLAAAITSCGADREQSSTLPTPTGTSGTGDAAALSAKTWCEGINVTLTGYYARCFGGTTEQWRALVAEQVACTEVSDEVRQARLSFDAQKASACTSALGAASCGRDGLDIESCEGTLTGAVAAGESCSDSSYCVEGTRCAIPQNSCSGSCTLITRVAVGESCAGARCAEGSFCSYDGSPSTPVCKALGNAGQACSSDFECADSLWCDDMMCAAPKPAGAACSGRYNECTDDLLCAGPEGARACRRPKKLGEACTAGDEECIVGYCSNGICAFGPELGQMCGRDGPEEASCQQGYCSAESSGTCQAYKAAGAPCQDRGECSSFECTGGVCQAELCP